MAEKKRTINDVMREHRKLLSSVEQANYGKVAPVFMGAKEPSLAPLPKESAESRELRKLTTSQFLVGVGIEQPSSPKPETAQAAQPAEAEPVSPEPEAEDPALESFDLESPAPSPDGSNDAEPSPDPSSDTMSLGEEPQLEMLEPDASSAEPTAQPPEMPSPSVPSFQDVSGVVEVDEPPAAVKQIQQATEDEAKQQGAAPQKQPQSQGERRVAKRKQAQAARRATVLRNKQRQQSSGFVSDTPFGGLQDFRGGAEETNDTTNQTAGIQEGTMQGSGQSFSSATDTAMGLVTSILEQTADAMMDVANRLRIVEAKLERLH